MRSVLSGFAAVALLVLMAVPAVGDPGWGGGGEAQGHAETIPTPRGGGGEVVAHVRDADSGPGGASGPDRGPGSSDAGGIGSSQGLITTHWRRQGPFGCPVPGVDPSGRPDRYDLVRVDYRTDPPTETVIDSRCFPPDDPPPVSDPPPPPPTIEEITQVARAQIRPPAIKVNPDWGGVTGLESWFWYEGQDQVTVAAVIRGYSVTASARPARYYWDPCADYQPPEGYRTNGARGCPALLESTGPGSRPRDDGDGHEAAARFLYETRGTYEIRHQVVWDGTWSFTGPAGAIASGRLATIRATSARPGYVVEEIRSELHSGR